MKLKYKALLLATVSLNALNAMAVAVNVTGTPTINPAVDYPTATQFNIGASARPTFTGDLNVPMVFGAHYASEIVTFQNQMKISAPITVLGNYSGAIVFANDGVILNDNIGDSVNRFNAISFSSNVGGSTVEAGKSIYVNIFYTYSTDNSVLNFTDIQVDNTTQFHDSSALIFNDSNLNSATLNIGANSSPAFNNGTITSANLNIYNASTPTFNNNTIKVAADLNIYDNASPTFNNNTFNLSSNLNIYGSATPIFNDNTDTHGLNIAGSSSPTFADLHSNRTSCYGNSTPTFNGTVTIDDTLIVSQNANATFNGNVSVGGILDIYDQSKSVFAKDVTAIGAIKVYGTAQTEFKGNVAGSSIEISNTPTITLGEGFTSNTYLHLIPNAAPTFKGNIISNIAPAIHRLANIDFVGNVVVSSDIGISYRWIEQLNFSIANGEVFELKNGANIYAYQTNIDGDGSATYKIDGNITGETIDITESAKPIFNGALTANAVAVAANSEPIFNSGTINSTNFTISGTSTPTFNGVQVSAANGINIEDSPTITLNEGFTLDTKFNIKDNATPIFEGTLLPPVGLSSNTQTLNFGENIVIKDKIETTVHST